MNKRTFYRNQKKRVFLAVGDYCRKRRKFKPGKAKLRIDKPTENLFETKQ